MGKWIKGNLTAPVGCQVTSTHRCPGVGGFVERCREKENYVVDEPISKISHDRMQVLSLSSYFGDDDASMEIRLLSIFAASLAAVCNEHRP